MLPGRLELELSFHQKQAESYQNHDHTKNLAHGKNI